MSTKCLSAKWFSTKRRQFVVHHVYVAFDVFNTSKSGEYDSSSNWEVVEPIFSGQFHRQGVLNNDSTVWLVGARPPCVSFIGPALA